MRKARTKSKATLWVTGLALCIGIVLEALTGCGTQTEHPGPATEGETVTQDPSATSRRARLESEYGPYAVRLIGLLENEERPYYEEEAYAGARAPDPDKPSIPEALHFALADLTLDGQDELLVAMAGYSGSSMNATYAVYDVMTGERLGELVGSISQGLYEARIKETGEKVWIAVMHLQMGVAHQYFYTTEIRFAQDTGSGSFIQTPLFHTEEFVQETDTLRKYYVGENEVEKSAYERAVAEFESTYEEIPGTRVVYVDPVRNGDPEENALTVAEKLLGARSEPLPDGGK